MGGEVPSDKELGRQLMEVVQSIPNLDGDTITNMLNSHMQVCANVVVYQFYKSFSRLKFLLIAAFLNDNNCIVL